jgi:hypothetical protein
MLPVEWPTPGTLNVAYAVVDALDEAKMATGT